MHSVKIIHYWKEIDRFSSGADSTTTVNECVHCGTKQEVLHLGRDSGPSFRDSLDNEVLDLLRSTFDRWDEVVQSMKEMFEQLVDETEYGSIDEVFEEIDRLSQRAVDGSNLPHRELQLWLSKPRYYRVINLLPHFQGRVCNRCDRIFSSTVEPTVDHIDGNRTNAHPWNLQLLCRECNEKKDDNPPDERDKSPFFFDGATCHHELTCVELYATQSIQRSDRETLP